MSPTTHAKSHRPYPAKASRGDAGIIRIVVEPGGCSGDGPPSAKQLGHRLHVRRSARIRIVGSGALDQDVMAEESCRDGYSEHSTSLKRHRPH